MKHVNTQQLKLEVPLIMLYKHVTGCTRTWHLKFLTKVNFCQQLHRHHTCMISKLNKNQINQNMSSAACSFINQFRSMDDAHIVTGVVYNQTSETHHLSSCYHPYQTEEPSIPSDHAHGTVHASRVVRWLRKWDAVVARNAGSSRIRYHDSRRLQQLAEPSLEVDRRHRGTTYHPPDVSLPHRGTAPRPEEQGISRTKAGFSGCC